MADIKIFLTILFQLRMPKFQAVKGMQSVKNVYSLSSLLATITVTMIYQSLLSLHITEFVIRFLTVKKKKKIEEHWKFIIV